MTKEEAINILCTCGKKADWKHTEGMIQEACRIVSTLKSPPNVPLTLEELREMNGEPVWVEIPEHCVNEWCIAKFDPLMGRMRLWCSGGGWFDGKNCGKSIFIYRRKPEEGTV